MSIAEGGGREWSGVRSGLFPKMLGDLVVTQLLTVTVACTLASPHPRYC